MNDALVRTLVACGLSTRFGNSRTSAMQFVVALDRMPGMLGLAETIVTCCANGYGRHGRAPGCHAAAAGLRPVENDLKPT